MLDAAGRRSCRWKHRKTTALALPRTDVVDEELDGSSSDTCAWTTRAARRFHSRAQAGAMTTVAVASFGGAVMASVSFVCRKKGRRGRRERWRRRERGEKGATRVSGGAPRWLYGGGKGGAGEAARWRPPR